MTRDNGQGIFSMVAINDVATMKSLNEAKGAAYTLIEASAATAQNKKKASDMVSCTASVKALIFGMTNFSLSHQGLKTIR
jgi:hypothetical protein